MRERELAQLVFHEVDRTLFDEPGGQRREFGPPSSQDPFGLEPSLAQAVIEHDLRVEIASAKLSDGSSEALHGSLGPALRFFVEDLAERKVRPQRITSVELDSGAAGDEVAHLGHDVLERLTRRPDTCPTHPAVRA